MRSVTLNHQTRALLAATIVACSAGAAQAGADFVVTVPGPFIFIVNGQTAPTLTLERGTTYEFRCDQNCFHPFLLTLAGSGGPGTVPYTVGVTGSPACNGSSLFFTPSAATPDTVFYVCSSHGGMGSTINIITPPPPDCAGDANGDNEVNAADLSVLLSQFGQAVPPGTGADFNDDGQVNAADLSVLLGRFGATC